MSIRKRSLMLTFHALTSRGTFGLQVFMEKRIAGTAHISHGCRAHPSITGTCLCRCLSPRLCHGTEETANFCNEGDSRVLAS